ncbi:MAG: hypothetical protein VYE77_11200 [Planctomycetota bacterium]|nr:hypothetical protein [Planctomycetota bacterium]
MRSLIAVPVLLSLASSAFCQEVEWWQGDLDGALAAAANTDNQRLLLYFWSEGHGECTAMFGNTLSDKAVTQKLADYVCMGCKREDAAGKALFDRFNISRVPTVLIVESDGLIEDAVVGVKAPKLFLDELDRIAKGEDTVASVRKAAEGSPDDAALQMRMAKKLRDIGDSKSANKTLAAIIEADPKLKTEVAGEARLLQILDETFRPELGPAEVELKPLQQFVIKQKNKRLRFLGYDQISSAEFAREDNKAGIEAVAKAWKNVPPDQLIDWGFNTGATIYRMREGFGKKELKLGLEISTRVLKETEKVKGDRGNPFLVEVLYLHGCMQIANSKRKPGFGSLERAIELDPKNENIKAALDRFRSGHK